MICSECRTVLQAFLDGELDVVRQVEIEDHLRTCDACSRIHQAQLALRSALKSEELYFRAPAHLDGRFEWRRNLRNARRRCRVRGCRPGSPPASPPRPSSLSRSSSAPVLSRPSRTERIAQDVVSAHIRSLMPGHLTDVASSEHHTVKPWFAGKLDFSPPVADLSAEGFQLVGGRLDYAADRPVAALVYRKGEHFINLFVWPSASNRESAEAADARQGYNLLFWTRGQTNFWAISDMNATELKQFADLVKSRPS